MSTKLIIPLILGVLVLILFGLMVITIRFNSKPIVPSNTEQPPISQLVTKPPSFPTQIKDTKPISTFPTRIPPGENTGVLEEELPKETRDLAVQKMELRAKMPLALPEFSIDFNYETDRFTVVLIGDKKTSESVFTSWLSTNYPAISIDRFNIQ